jgi:molybdate/tungstate transport system substrate-binding protein
LHQLTLARLSPLALALAVIVSGGGAAAATSPAAVSVLYAGSLVTPMEGPVKNALHDRGIDLQGEPGGSKALANLIAAGVRSPDVFVYVDPKLVIGFRDKVATAVPFASTTLGIAWAPGSRQAALFERVAAGSVPLERALATPGLRIGRTDPQLDPKGFFTVAATTAWLGAQRERAILGADNNPEQIFPEQDLLARVDTGQADVGFFYRTEAVARGYHFIQLPGETRFSNGITYVLAIMKGAKHPSEAKAFADFILTGPGREILERAGLDYLPQGK